ncbi:copia protein [Tanacetum coccineum]
MDGPAGIFKDDPTQEYIRKRNFDDVSEDDDFQSSPWVKALEFMNDREEIGGGCFGDIESYLKKGKLEIVVAIITSCKPNVLGDMNVTLKDPSGTTSGTIHYKVLSSEDGYAKDIKVGSALILRNGFAAALAVLVTGASQSRQHESHHRFFPVDTSLIHIESRKSPTKSLFDVGSRRISIFTVNTKEYHSDVLAIITRIMRRT